MCLKNIEKFLTKIIRVLRRKIDEFLSKYCSLEIRKVALRGRSLKRAQMSIYYLDETLTKLVSDSDSSSEK